MPDPIPLHDLTREQVAERLNYDPDTGVFLWAISPCQRMKAGDVAGGVNNEGYVNIEIKGRAYKAHRLAWLVVTGEWPRKHVDHINGRRDDNRFCNLREASRKENGQNRRLNKNNNSGHIGVYQNPNGTWRAQIKAGTQIYLGQFDTAEEAAAAYVEAKRRLHTFQPVAPQPSRIAGAA